MTDIVCRCGEAWDATGGLHASHTDMPWHHFENLIHGAGCPCCHGDFVKDEIRDRKWAASLQLATDELEPYPGFPIIWTEEQAWGWEQRIGVVKAIQGKLKHGWTGEQADLAALLLKEFTGKETPCQPVEDDDMICVRLGQAFWFDESQKGRANQAAFDEWWKRARVGTTTSWACVYDETTGIEIEIGRYDDRTGSLSIDPYYLAQATVLHAELATIEGDVWDENNLEEIVEGDRQSSYDDFVENELAELLKLHGLSVLPTGQVIEQLIEYNGAEWGFTRDHERVLHRLFKPLGWLFYLAGGRFMAVPVGYPQPDPDRLAGVWFGPYGPETNASIANHEFTPCGIGLLDCEWGHLSDSQRAAFCTFCQTD